MSRSQHMNLWQIIIFALCVMLTSCLPANNPPVPEVPTPSPPMDSNQADVPPSSTQPETAVQGQIIRKSDVSTINNIPVEDAYIFAVTQTAFDSLISNVTLLSEQADWQNGRFTIDEPTFNSHISLFTRSNNNGDYKLILPPNEYILCIATNDASSTSPFPRLVPGCQLIVISQGETIILNISWGFGGLTFE